MPGKRNKWWQKNILAAKNVDYYVSKLFCIVHMDNRKTEVFLCYLAIFKRMGAVLSESCWKLYLKYYSVQLPFISNTLQRKPCGVVAVKSKEVNQIPPFSWTHYKNRIQNVPGVRHQQKEKAITSYFNSYLVSTDRKKKKSNILMA